MSADQLLDLITRVTGVGLAVAGAVVGAPGGWARFRVNSTRIARAVRARLQVLVSRMLRRPLRVPVGIVAGSATSTMSAPTSTATGWVWDPGATVEARLDNLRARTQALSAQLTAATQQSREADAALQAAIDAVTAQVDRETARIDAVIEDMRVRDALAEASSLPLIALGVTLTALSPQISGYGLAVWAGTMFVLVVVVPVLWWRVAVRD